jgi:hypothetical protein
MHCAALCTAAPPSLSLLYLFLSFDQNLAEHWRWYLVGGEALPFLFLRLPKRAVPELNPGTTLDWRHGFPAGVLSSVVFVLRRFVFSLAARFMSVGRLV